METRLFARRPSIVWRAKGSVSKTILCMRLSACPRASACTLAAIPIQYRPTPTCSPSRSKLSPKFSTPTGYRTACTGEMPFAPRSYTGGFQRVLATNRDYDKFLAAHGLKFPPSEGRFQASPAPWTDDLDETAFFAHHAREFLRSSLQTPFFLHVNFRRPHHPFNPPAPTTKCTWGRSFLL